MTKTLSYVKEEKDIKPIADREKKVDSARSVFQVLCVENAFAHRLDITPYRSGFAVIYEAFVQWIQVLQWPLIISSSATTVSILWRLVMLYFAYRRMVCATKPPSRAGTFTQQPSAYEQLKINLSQKDGGRLNDYDEFWPVRYSVRKIYGPPSEGNYEEKAAPLKSNKETYENVLVKVDRLSDYAFIKTLQGKVLNETSSRRH
ncbi:unnamed protein product [Gongylonema pulchrum]|uniref:Bestrophin homolog n=1 Tax=Gongylonema pulchrum TaxID=637853 RepID=A0A183DUB8_9BILA|nr:unnamed protein product [Gongylonema pulchrum]